MIRMFCNSQRNEYDIRPLIMSFFPGETLEYEVKDLSACENIADIIEELEKNIHSGEVVTGEDTVILGAFCDGVIWCKLIEKDGRQTWESQILNENITDKFYRDTLKRFIYRVLKEGLKRTVKWGTLTGVRPSKVPMKYLLEGLDEKSTVSKLMDEYYMSEEKAHLSTTVAKNELAVLEKTGYETGYSVYIGIPFCPTVCNYCSFSSISLAKLKDGEKLMLDYLAALKKECQAVKEMMQGKRMTSLYVGGGTPTALNEEGLKLLMDMIRENFDVDGSCEFTVEAGRPDSINEEKLRILKDARVTRISVNPQTMKDDTLKIMGRNHTVCQVKEAFHMARRMGFDNINMDLIAGLMDESVFDFENTMKEIMALGPDSFTVHSLVVKRASRYRNEQEKNKHEGATDQIADDKGFSNDTVEDMLSIAEKCAGDNSYEPYYMYRQKNKAGLGCNSVLENVGYSKKGKEGLYNILIMEEMQSIIALGAGASSKLLFGDRIERVANVKNVYEYISRIDEMIERKRRGLNDE